MTPTLADALRKVDEAIADIETACSLSADQLHAAARALIVAAQVEMREKAAHIVESWPHEPPHVVHILSKRAESIRALPVEEESR